MPFGEEITPDGTHRTSNLKYNFGDNIRQKFTGYQKDEETQLDFAEARMYQNLHGRFTAVDPFLASGKSSKPQSFNRYVYVMNNPLIFTDPSGLQAGTYYLDLGDGRWALANYAKRGYTPYKGPARTGRAPDGTRLWITKNGWSPIDDVVAAKAARSRSKATAPSKDAINTPLLNDLARRAPTLQIINTGLAILMVSPAAGALVPGAAAGTSAAAAAATSAPISVTGPLTTAGTFALGTAAERVINGSDDSESSPEVPNILVSSSAHPEAALHISEAQAEGYPSILTIDRPGRCERSRAALEGYPSMYPDFERDEYPPAVFLEGGRGSSVCYINPWDNRGAGASIGNQLRPYPDGQQVRIVVVP